MRAVLILVASLVCLLASGIVLPAPTRALLPLAVGAPELSAWLLAAAVLTALLAWRGRSGPGRRATLILSLLAGGLALRPLIQIPGAIRNIDARLGAVSGLLTGSGLRPGAISVRELFMIAAPGGGALRTVDVPYAAADGSPLRVRVYQPAIPAGPVIIQIYGGAWQRGAPADDPAMASYLAGRGYVVFALDYRHAPRWRWPAQRDDVRVGVDWVRTHAGEYGGDAGRMALVGRSAGGHLALLAAYSGQPGVRSVISLYGPTDLIRGYRELPRPDPIDVRTTLRALMGGAPDDMERPYREASPVHYAASPQPPTLQIIGARDHVVLPRFAGSLDEQLRAAGNVSVLIELPWAEHAFDAVPFGPGAQLATYAVERFLAATLSER